MTTEIDAALAAIAGHPAATRLHALCADDNPDAEQRDAYRAMVIRMAAGADPAPPPPIRVDYGAPALARPCCGGPPIQ